MMTLMMKLAMGAEVAATWERPLIEKSMMIPSRILAGVVTRMKKGQG